MRFPSKEVVELLKREYSEGSRVVLEEMDDAQAPPVGAKGIVICVNDAGSIMAWLPGTMAADSLSPTVRTGVVRSTKSDAGYSIAILYL